CALLLHRRIVDGKVDLHRSAAFLELEQLDLVIKRIQREFRSCLDREAREIRPAPGQPEDRLVALRILGLLGASKHRMATFRAEAVALEPVALPARGEADQLDRASRE